MFPVYVLQASVFTSQSCCNQSRLTNTRHVIVTSWIIRLLLACVTEENDRTDLDAVWGVDSPKEPCIRWGPDIPREGALWGNTLECSDLPVVDIFNLIYKSTGVMQPLATSTEKLVNIGAYHCC